MLLLAVGCAQSSTPPPPTEQASPTAVRRTPPQAVLPDGFLVDLELALTPQEVANGLMYRPSLPENRGMLFLFDAERLPSFWMKNTLIPLDLIFLDSAGVVVDVVPNVPPCAADPCPTYSPGGPAKAVLEVAAGAAAAHGVEAGTTIAFDRVPGYPVPSEQPSEATTDS
jgi:uncharacterized membrane protein (UPF0127 family)